jgi:hypothetical protein
LWSKESGVTLLLQAGRYGQANHGHHQEYKQAEEDPPKGARTSTAGGLVPRLFPFLRRHVLPFFDTPLPLTMMIMDETHARRHITVIIILIVIEIIATAVQAQGRSQFQVALLPS